MPQGTASLEPAENCGGLYFLFVFHIEMLTRSNVQALSLATFLTGGEGADVFMHSSKDPSTESPSLWANVAQESIRVGYEEEGSGKHTCLDFWSGIQKRLSISDSGLGFSDSK